MRDGPSVSTHAERGTKLHCAAGFKRVGGERQ
jgi:hypothetical protein